MFTFEIDLNGGDNQSDNADLIFKIYDSGVLHYTTGSVNSDANVSAVGDIVTIINVPSIGGQSYDFTVGVVDEAGNESTVSNEVSITATSGTLIYQNDFTSALNGVTAVNGTVTISGTDLLIEGSSGVSDKGFSLANSNFTAPDNVNFVNGTTYAFEVDVVSFVGCDRINNAYPAPVQTEQVLSATTFRWERNDMSNGSFQILAGKSSGAAWVSGDQCVISEVRVYKIA